MLLAAEWNFGDFVLGVLYVFAVVILLWLIFTVFIDVFRRRDINGWVKTLWVIFVVLLPWFGVLIYLLTQHDGMAERSGRAAVQEREELRRYVGYSSADELEKLDRMRSEGRLSDEEYQKLRARVVS